MRNYNFCKNGETKRLYTLLYALCAMRGCWHMKEEKEDELEEAKELFKDGLKKIFRATQKVSEKVVEGFREGFAKDANKKESD